MKILQTGVASTLRSLLVRYGWAGRSYGNSVAHVTLISSDDETKARIRRYNCMVVLVNLCGIVIFKSGPGQNAALKVEIATGLLICCFQTLREVGGGATLKVMDGQVTALRTVM